MKVTIKKDASGREIASCENVNGGYQHLQDDYVFIRAYDGAVMIGDGQGLREAKTDQEVAMAHAFQSVKALCPIVKETPT